MDGRIWDAVDAAGQRFGVLCRTKAGSSVKGIVSEKNASCELTRR